MFFTGDLNSAIGEAIRESKSVACLVTDNEEKSQLWENDYLQDSSIKDILLDQAILLKLNAGSTEAGYLAEIIPIPNTPTFVVIKSGKLKEYLTPDVEKCEFLRRLISIFEPSNPVQSTTESGVQSQTPSQIQEPAHTPNIPETSLTSNTIEENASVDNPIEDRNTHNHEADIGPQRQISTKEDCEERARILKRVEDDKVNRRNEASRRKAERNRDTGTTLDDAICTKDRSFTPKAFSTDTCYLVIRLFDGSNVRQKFPSTATLSNEVRAYISQHKPSTSDQPYVFKQVQSPSPIRTIEAAEEIQSLYDLGFVPSTTLILSPVHIYTEAYSTRGAGAVVGGLLEVAAHSGWGLIRGGVNMIRGTLGNVIGSSSHDREGESRSINAGYMNLPSSTTPQDLPEISRRDKVGPSDEQQFYNGNSINYQPRLDDDDSDENKRD